MCLDSKMCKNLEDVDCSVRNGSYPRKCFKSKTKAPEKQRPISSTEFAGSVENRAFNYVDITTKGCEGWLNLFFGDECIALVNDVSMANEMREQMRER